MNKKLKAIYLISQNFHDLIYGDDERRELEQMLEFVCPGIDPEELSNVSPETLNDVEVIVTGWGMVEMNSAMLELFPKLQLILYGAGSIKNVVTPEMWDRGVRIVSAWAANAVPVAEFSLAEIIFSLKHGWAAMEYYKQGHGKRRKRSEIPPGGYGSTVGLISLGMIGRILVRMLRMFDMRIIAYDPFVSGEQAEELGIELVSLEKVFSRSDVISCHTPWLKETEKMLRKEHFETMKQDATFINTARGAVVDEPAMIEVLKKRPDIYAVLDVTYPEPPEEDSSLYDLPNVVLTPHIAGSMGPECRRMGHYMVEELKLYLDGQSLKHEITREMAATMA